MRKASPLQEKVKTAGDQRKEPVVIKKYANRRLYNTETSSYVTLDDLAQMVRAERDFVVFDAKSGDDLTHTVLTQIIVEQEGRGASLLPVPFLRQLIRFYGDSMSAFVPSYLQLSMESLAREQERYRKQFAHVISGKAFAPAVFGTSAFEAMQEQARQNMALVEKAMTMFSPFQPPGLAAEQPGSAPNGAQTPHDKAEAGGKAAAGANASELEELRAQMAAMQAKIEKFAGGTS